MDNVLAKPADLCCLKGSFHSGEANGSTIQIDGIDTYVAKPHPDRSNGNILLFFPDAFGLHTNSFLMMDAFAECGYLTLGVDYFLGVRMGPYLEGCIKLTVVGPRYETLLDTVERPKL